MRNVSNVARHGQQFGIVSVEVLTIVAGQIHTSEHRYRESFEGLVMEGEV